MTILWLFGVSVVSCLWTEHSSNSAYKKYKNKFRNKIEGNTVEPLPFYCSGIFTHISYKQLTDCFHPNISPVNIHSTLLQ